IGVTAGTTPSDGVIAAQRRFDDPSHLLINRLDQKNENFRSIDLVL
ncbi:hypothetical protein A2U01_0091195, partial [Trifolium medium]|nr:hypothetical protein [Trifolium medium]